MSLADALFSNKVVSILFVMSKKFDNEASGGRYTKTTKICGLTTSTINTSHTVLQ